MSELAETVPFVWPCISIAAKYSGSAVFELPSTELNPAWRMLLAGDASPTRVFQVLSGSKTKITLIEEATITDAGTSDVPEEVRKSIDAPWIRRRVWLANEAGLRFGYAVSWWNETVYKEMMPDPTRPIGGSLALAKAEVHREIFAVYKGRNADILRAFVGARDVSSESGDLWARHYNMWKNGKAFAMICEVFSPTLQTYMGSYGATPPPSPVLRPDQ